MKIPHHRLSAAAAYERIQTPPTQTPARADTAKPASESQPTQSAATPTQAGALSADEQQMIDRYFPPQPKLALRLYGPGREAQAVNPTAIGGRLDLSA